MKVIRSKVLGFCMGVQRSVAMASSEAANADGRVYTFGPLIHNPKVLADLKKAGVEVLDDLPKNPDNCTVVIRAHGIQPEIENDLRSIGARIVDATCPNVKNNQLKAEELASAGYYLFLAGEADHAEIKGILGYANSGSASHDGSSSVFCVVVNNVFDAGRAAAKLYRIKHDAKTALIGQTTISENEYLCIGESIRNFFPNLEILQTICNATTDRQQALRDLLEQVDAALVIGGKESANTGRLYAIAKGSGKPCALIESVGDIPPDFKNYKTVGICAGASTPESLIIEVENELLR